MARKKDLASLAALAGAAYLMNKEKAAPAAAASDVPERDTSWEAPYTADMGPQASDAAAPEDAGAVMAEDGSMSTSRRNTETGDVYSTEMSAPPARAAARAAPAAQKTPAKKGTALQEAYARTAPSTSRSSMLNRMREKDREIKGVRPYAKGGEVKSGRGDGCATRGKTKGRMV